MEDTRIDLQRNLGKPMKSSLSGRSTPRNSPSFRRLNSSRTPRKDGRNSGFSSHWFRSNQIVLWLLLITLWAYGGFYVQSRWAHGDNKDGIFYGSDETSEEKQEPDELIRRDLLASSNSSAPKMEINRTEPVLKKMDAIVEKTVSSNTTSRSTPPKRKNRRSRRKARGKQKMIAVKAEQTEVEVQEEEIPKKNTTYGLLVGPFGSIEDSILDWSPQRRSGTCDRKGAFAKLVWSRKFVLIFHELSMTGAPLSMMELATELLSCGATVSAVILSKKGGLLSELARRKIRVLEDKEKVSFKTAMKADLVIAGSAVCASWIEQYLEQSVAGQRQLVWWIMENRREYFNRSKLVLDRVKSLYFLSESQSKQWLAWCEEENIKLKSPPSIVPLSVNDELAFVAGISCSLNTPAASPEKMLEKRLLLRNAVRKEMGLTENDMLAMSLSSINPGKGHFLLLESVRSMIEQGPAMNDSAIESAIDKTDDYHSRALLQESPTKLEKNQTLKILIGSVGSKSNKIPYVKAILKFLSQNSNLSNSVLWTPATTRVASLYAAADVYVINSQGLGETFGRVTVEAMAFGLPVLGTDAGGTKEIVEQNISGLLHPSGRAGTQILSKNLNYMLQNPSERQQMGIMGRKKVEKMYLKKHMYKMLADAMIRSMRIK